MRNYGTRFELIGLLLASFCLLLFFLIFVPLHMDAFCHFHVIAWKHYPHNALNTFREGSETYDLAPVGELYLPLRSYQYIGSAPSLLYYPLFLLWPSPHSARLLGLIVLAVQGLLIHKLFRRGLLFSFLFLLFFMPYAFQHIVDYGTLCLQTTLIFLIFYLVTKWKECLKKGSARSWTYPLLMGLTVFLGIWTKLTFITVLPGIAAIVLYTVISNRSLLTSLKGLSFGRLIRHFIIFGMAAGIPCFLYFNSVDRAREKYFSFLLNKADSIQGPKFDLFKFVVNPMLSAHRNFKMSEDAWFSPEGIVLCILFLFFLVYGLRRLFQQKLRIAFPLLAIVSFLFSLVFISMHKQSWSMHHVALSYPFLIMAMFYVGSRIPKNKVIAIIVALFFIVNSTLYLRMAKKESNPWSHAGLEKINMLVNREYADRYVSIVVDWGMYYIKALYGPQSQCVLYVNPFKYKQQVAKVKEILGKLERKALFIKRARSKNKLAFIKNWFPEVKRLEMDFDAADWEIWYEP